MRNIFKLFGISSLFIFSFFYLGKTNDFLINSSSLLNEINSLSLEYKISAVDAYVYGEYVIPGVNGQEINILDSYYNMNPYDSFNELFLVYDNVSPNNSICDYMDKYIEKGNPALRNISIIIDDNLDVENFLIQNNIVVNKIYFDDVDINFEYVYGSYFSEIYLDSGICIVNSSNEDFCRENNYFLIKPLIYVDNTNIFSIKKELYSGEILYITNNLSLENFASLLIEINFRDYNIVLLSFLLSE